MNKDYLKYDKEAIEKIKKLFESGQKENIALALKLIEGGEVTQELFTHLFAVYILCDGIELRGPALILCLKIPSYKEFHDNRTFSRCTSFEEIITAGENYSAIDTHLLAKLIYRQKGELATYCLKHRLLPPQEIFAKINDYPTILSLATYCLKHRLFPSQEIFAEINDYPTILSLATYCFEHNLLPVQEILVNMMRDPKLLCLRNMNLSYLPPEVGLFTDITVLDIEGNNFSDIPDEIQNLVNLKFLPFRGTPLNDKALKKLEIFFPVIMARHYGSMALVASSEESFRDYDAALSYLEKATSLDPSSSSYWNNKAYMLQKLSRYEEALESINTGLEAYKKYPDINEYMEESLYTRKGTVYLHLKQYNKAHEAYNKAIGVDSFLGKVNILYNKARAYAQEHKKNEMLDYLHQAICYNQDLREQTLYDSNFRNYRKDKDFVALVKGVKPSEK